MTTWQIPHEFELPRNVALPQLAGAEINPMQLDPPGPVGEAYMFGTDAIEFIMGPVGSAKTTCSIFRILISSLRMPVCSDGVIRSRGCVVHANLRALYRTAVPSLQQFFKPGSPGVEYSGGQDRPLQLTLRFQTPSGKKLQIIIDGFGITKDSMEELLRGYQANFAWCVEADQLDSEVPPFLYSRVAQGRYPGKGLLADPEAAVPGSVWGDLNAPLITNYIYTDFIEKPRPGYVLHRQPSGLSDKAENRKFVSKESYEKLDQTLPPDKSRRMVKAEFGVEGDGALVYSSYRFDIHCAKKPLQPLDLPLLLGSDAGGSPALVIGQYTPKGHMRWLDELVTDPGTGAGRFAEYLVDLLQSKYRGLPISNGWGDPSAFHGADRQAGELSFMEIVGKAINIHMLPTVTNDPSARQESVDWFLRRGVDESGFPYFQHCPSMRVVQGGFQGGFKVVKNIHDSSDKVAFLKNKFSHVHEGGQYLCYGVRGHAGVINDAARAGRPGNVVPISSGKGPRKDFNL
ncbi:hypothetical protein [Bradyrhizobium elkanii]|uniref:TerL n=1 Tax=Bradyrhizobium elkanii TaxID=29448 RepID=A0A8I1YBC0_BRAEL|nr:hypothetical protein [Bradyrhizobium elkanii]MBP1296627.1 hypothetical protein [Bradyrhizobium elkanii]